MAAWRHELTRRLDNLIRPGTIAVVDHAGARCRVQSGEQCVVFSPSGEMTAGFVLLGIYSDDNPQPARPRAMCTASYSASRIISVVREGMLSPQAAVEFERELRERIEQEAQQVQSGTSDPQRRLNQLDADISRLVDALAAAGSSAALLARLQSAEREREQLAFVLQEVPQGQMNLPDVRHIYRTRLVALNDALKKEPATARTALRDILGRIDIELREDAQVWAKIKTAPALLMALGAVSNSGSGGQI